MVDWFPLLAALLTVALAIAVLLRRRIEIEQHAGSLAERAAARERGSHRARLQHPAIDLSRCIGCGACVRACPEDGVLALAFGQAVVVHGARCVGHGLCAQACPTNAIRLTLAELEERRDLPAIDAGHEAVGMPGLFLAGEITGFALVRTAVAHGALVAQQVAARCAEQPADPGGPMPDLLVVGLGPAGLSCMLAAQERGLRAVGVDQANEVGGTVAAYPRKKLVMTQPMDLPLHGRLKRLEYTKEQLVELWQGLARRHRLDVRTGTTVRQIERAGDGSYVVVTDRGTIAARNVCLAVGRRGSPRRLGVPGEDLPKVGYALLDAESYRDRSILVVGGGDSAIEAALALAEQPGNTVTLSYRRHAFSRLKARNEARIAAAIEAGTIDVRFETEVVSIAEGAVVLQTAGAEPDATPAAPRDGGTGRAHGAVATAQLELPNDDVFVFAGGTPPFPLLESAGVSFDPALRPLEAAPVERGTGLLIALGSTLLALLALVGLRQWHADYYDLPVALRTGSSQHDALRPQSALGLFAGLAAAALFAANLAYLLRRAPALGRFLPGSLKVWMNAHVATGLGACLCAVLHSGFAVRDSAGGHALLAMIVVVAAGVVGRWFYAFVPRAQNGRQQDIEELGSQVAALAGEWDRDGRGFGTEVRREVEQLVDGARFGKNLLSRVRGLLLSQWHLRRRLTAIRVRARAEGVPAGEVARIVQLARRSHRLALQLTHFDDVRSLLATWRWLHRWLALALLLLTIVHVVAAVRFGGVDFGVLRGGGGAG